LSAFRKLQITVGVPFPKQEVWGIRKLVKHETVRETPNLWFVIQVPAMTSFSDGL
jgi:RNA polymerase-interacting CarD/CdnL/TRCF family regulator